MPSATKSHINIHAIRLNSKRIHTLLQHHRHMITHRISHPNLLPYQIHPLPVLPDRKNPPPTMPPSALRISTSTKPLSSPEYTPTRAPIQSRHTPANS